MFDFSHLPQNAIVNEYVITAQFVSSGTVPSYTWSKPANCRLVFILAIGGGGGGCGGPSINGVSASGGGGGGSGAIAQGLFLAESVSQILYIGASSLSGAPNGLGGAPNSAGGIGVSVFVSNYPDAAVSNQTVSKYIYATGGGGGQTTFSGSGGYAQNSNNVQLSQAAIYYTTISGRNGTWTSQSGPGNTSIGAGLPILGGGGGGGVNAALTSFNGAGFTSEISSILPSIDGGLALSALDASNGIRLPFIITGGSGGGAYNGGPGGRGGNGGGYGAGGGGGGAGTTGGRGGNGGPGYACIIAW